LAVEGCIGTVELDKAGKQRSGIAESWYKFELETKGFQVQIYTQTQQHWGDKRGERMGEIGF
jgi:hypothetical protein